MRNTSQQNDFCGVKIWIWNYTVHWQTHATGKFYANEMFTSGNTIQIKVGGNIRD